MSKIQDLKEATLGEINKIFEFKLHTEMAYRHFQEYGPEAIQTVNAATNIIYGKGDLISHYGRYSSEYLPALSFQHLLNIFEAFFFDLLGLILTTETQYIAGAKKVDVEIVLSAADRPALVSLIVQRELNELKYAKIADWFVFLNKILKCNYATQHDIERIAEARASRDILVHNSGIVNSTYIDKSGQAARYSEGERLQVTHHYFHETWALVKKLVQSMCDATLQKL